VLDGAIDTSTPTGRLMFNVVSSIAQFEREMMLERQREGIARALKISPASVYRIFNDADAKTAA